MRAGDSRWITDSEAHVIHRWCVTDLLALNLLEDWNSEAVLLILEAMALGKGLILLEQTGSFSCFYSFQKTAKLGSVAIINSKNVEWCSCRDGALYETAQM